MYKWARLGAANRNRAFYGSLLFLFTIPVCRAVLVNRTIDSNLGDPVTGFMPIYEPPQAFWSSQPCGGCYIQPDVAKAFDGTWNSADYIPGLQNVNLTLRFTGVAVWVFFILANAGIHGAGLTTNTQVNITLDGKNAGIFSHYPDMNMQDLTYNATIFSTSGLANTSHELVIGTNDYANYSYINFDWAIYTVDVNAPTPQSASTAFTPTTDSSSIASTSSPTSTPQRSSSKTGVIVGSTLGGLAVMFLVLVFLVRRLRRASPVRYKKDEGMLDIDVPACHQPYHKREIPVSAHEPTQSKAARLREERQREINEHIQSAQRELDNLRPTWNAGSADEIGDPSAAGPSQPSPELALLRNEMQQLRDRMDYLQAQRESDWAQGLSNEPFPPAYSQLSNNVR
ncbi:hypothetical protein M378DRAFT_123375 [Amanita muscaria Koide BX008]|uniref:Uncharacterized protein n=1 Tax=Amanita muscaria (strain Koide BX008) TaxID=946122 RepID=A0A0C2XCL5_AMAMK|nr:hypothetical protein M378DRAFT_123375 [Amanita muscaria Koide BX008]